MVRVTMFLQRFPTPQGGAERQLEALAPLLVDRGVELSIIAREQPATPPAFTHGEVHRVPVAGGRAAAALSYVFGSVRCIRSIRPDVVHAHGLLSPASAAMVAGRAIGAPVVAKVLLGGAYGEVGRLHAWRRGGPARMRALRAGLDRFIVISDEIDAELAAAGVPPAQRVAIPNGVDTDRFRPGDATTKQRRRQELGLNDGPIVLYVGRLNSQKGIEVLLRAWELVGSRFPTARLLVVGGSGRRESFAANLPQGVELVGQTDDVVPYLQAADVFALPSFAEGLSNALLEAMACGLPVVATSVGANAQVLGGAGRIVPPGDVEELGRALEELLDDADLRAASGARSRTAVEARYQLSDTADALVTLYRSLLVRG